MITLRTAALKLALALTIIAGVLPSQSFAQPKALGVIAGKITVDAKPAAGVLISLVKVDAARPYVRNIIAIQATTDTDGKFQLVGVPAGTFTLTPAAGPYVLPPDGDSGSPGKLVVLREGERLDGINLSLTRGGVITGKVVDSDGIPVIGKRVTLEVIAPNTLNQRMDPPTGLNRPDAPGLPDIKLRLARSETRIVRLPNSSGELDDRGVYRFYGVPAGRYRVSLRGGNQSTYYPGVTDETKATIIEVTEGSEASNIDITTAPNADVYEVSGTVINGDNGQPLPDVKFSYQARSASTSKAAGTARTNANGEFHIPQVPPGDYAIFAVPETEQNSYSERIFFRVVKSDVDSLQIKVHSGSTLSGVVVVPQSNGTDLLSGLQVVANQQADDGTPLSIQTKVATDGSFTIHGLRQGKAFLLASPERSLASRSTTVRVEKDGVEQTRGVEVPANGAVTGVRLVLAFADSDLRGQIRITKGALSNSTVFLVRLLETRGDRVVTSTRADSDLRFTLRNIPPGTYRIQVRALTTARPDRRLPAIEQLITLTSGVNDVVIPFNLDQGN